ncbi:unnamed protein product [Meloidogyne enterolobii]|uniref:Uncharacterized protein n=1 Tax=Meloidogyne enterolobii TaxID=390850 RepID=A0ACB0YC57_MELEN
MTAQLASAISAPDYYNCQMQPGLVKRQREICRQHPAAMRAISEGLRNAIDECHVQFQRVKIIFNIHIIRDRVLPLKLSKTLGHVLTED